MRPDIGLAGESVLSVKSDMLEAPSADYSDTDDSSDDDRVPKRKRSSRVAAASKSRDTRGGVHSKQSGSLTSRLRRAIAGGGDTGKQDDASSGRQGISDVGTAAIAAAMLAGVYVERLKARAEFVVIEREKSALALMEKR